MTRLLAYNVLRGVMGPFRRTPRGLERVDLDICDHLLEHWPGEMVGVLPSPWGMHYFPRDRIRSARDLLMRYWAETADTTTGDTGRLLQHLISRPQQSLAGIGPHQNLGLAVWRIVRMLWGKRPQTGTSVYRLPAGSIYLDIGQTLTIEPACMHVGRTARFLAARPDIQYVLKLHDLMPITHPDFYNPKAAQRHGRILDILTASGRCAMVPTQSVGKDLAQEMAARGRPDFPVHTVALGLNPVFTARPPPPAFQPNERYAIVCGSLEHRKNHMILLDAWEILHRRLGDHTPWLLIAGAMRDAQDTIAARLHASRPLSARVRIALDLPTAQIAQLMAGAVALLMPSRAEGFGLPPLEAMAAGTPALVSDIPPMRDACGDFARFLDPDDAMAWADAVEVLLQDDTGAKAQLADFRPKTVAGHAAEIISLLQSLG